MRSIFWAFEVYFSGIDNWNFFEHLLEEGGDENEGVTGIFIMTEYGE